MSQADVYKSKFHHFLEQAENRTVSDEEVSQSLNGLANFVYLLAEIDKANKARNQNDTKNQ